MSQSFSGDRANKRVLRSSRGWVSNLEVESELSLEFVVGSNLKVN